MTMPTWKVGRGMLDVQATAANAFLTRHIVPPGWLVALQPMVAQGLHGQGQRPLAASCHPLRRSTGPAFQTCHLVPSSCPSFVPLLLLLFLMRTVSISTFSIPLSFFPFLLSSDFWLSKGAFATPGDADTKAMAGASKMQVPFSCHIHGWFLGVWCCGAKQAKLSAKQACSL